MLWSCHAFSYMPVQFRSSEHTFHWIFRPIPLRLSHPVFISHHIFIWCNILIYQYICFAVAQVSFAIPHRHLCQTTCHVTCWSSDCPCSSFGCSKHYHGPCHVTCCTSSHNFSSLTFTWIMFHNLHSYFSPFDVRPIWCLRHMSPFRTFSSRCSSLLISRPNWTNVNKCWHTYETMFPILCLTQLSILPPLPRYCSRSKINLLWSNISCGKSCNCSCTTICKLPDTCHRWMQTNNFVCTQPSPTVRTRGCLIDFEPQSQNKWANAELHFATCFVLASSVTEKIKR